MAKFNEYPSKSQGSDNDTLLIFDSTENSNKQLKLSAVNEYVSGKSQGKFDEKLNKNQGAENSGKVMAVDTFGNVIPTDVDGSGAPYILNPMTEDVLGGGKAIPKTTESGQVAIDENGKLWAPSSSSADVENASSSKAGIMKLYSTSGQNTDGTMTQKAIGEAISEAINTSITQALGGDY